MVIGIVENLRSSYDFTNKAFRSFGDWLILIFISLLVLTGTLLVICGTVGLIMSLAPVYGIPVTPADPVSSAMTSMFGMAGAFSLGMLGFGLILSLVFGIFLTGVMIRVYRSGELHLGSWGGMFLDGLLATIITLLYMIPYCIISVLLKFGPMLNTAYVLVSLFIEIIVLIVTMMVLLMALIRFAKAQRFGAAFEFKELFNVIGTIGWLTYLVNIIVIGIVITVIYLILLLIPVVGWVLLIVIMPFLMIWEAKFFATLYESAVAVQEQEPAAPCCCT